MATNRIETLDPALIRPGTCTCTCRVYTVQVKKTFPISFNTVPFGFNKLRRNRMVPACTILRKCRLLVCFVPFCSISFCVLTWSSSKRPCWCLEDGICFGCRHLHRQVRLLACVFLLPCCRFILGAASVEIAWNETKQNATKRNNEMGSKLNGTTV